MMAGFGCWPRDFGALYRDPANGKVAGVCAGLGAHFGVNPKALRIGLVVASLFGFFLPILVGYGLLTLFLPVRDEAAGAVPGLAGAPARSAAELEERFRLLEARLARVEETVTSSDFQLRQKFRNL